MFPYIELITSCDLLTIFLPCRRDRWDFIEENKEPQLSKLIPSQRDIHKLFYSVVKLTPSIPQNINLNDLLASGYFSSFACTISSTLLIVYQIYNSISNQDNHSKKRFVHIVDVLIQSAAAYALTLMIVAIANVVLVTSRDNVTVSLYAVLSYEGSGILIFFSVCTFGLQILGKFWWILNQGMAPTIMVTQVALATDSINPTSLHISGLQFQGNLGINSNINSEMDNRVVVGHSSQEMDK